MVRAVYAVTRDRAWLARALPAIRTQYQYWTTAPHLAGATGLSRYRALGAGPAPEVVAGERDAGGRTHYDRVRADLRQHPPADLDVARYYDRRRDQLTPLAYRADRSMRESGFDPTDRFGRFSLAILDYAPVCLNSLLYAMETDTAQILRDAGDAAEAPAWDRRAQQRQRRIQDLLWDDRQGLFTDYDFVHRKKRRYPFATTFFPLWVGAASPKQARRVAETALPLLARPGGLLTSTNVSGSQWDAPFAWAPLQLVAVAGLRRYGFDREADRIAIAFLRTVLRAYVQRGAIFEKYDVDPAAGAAPSVPRFGYTTNEIGFGWTNGVFLELEAGLPPDGRAAIAD
jgi:alpha,alpha-trehalase